MAVETRISEDTYQQFVMSDPDHKWELIEGRLREKPGMTWEHNRTVMLLGRALLLQIDIDQFNVFFESRVRGSTGSILIPDLAVVPAVLGSEFQDRPGVLAIFSQPLPLVVEVWSVSTGDYDVDVKIPAYQRRGDLEIWRIHPYERTLTTWQLQPDGSYVETLSREGIVQPVALPGVSVELAALFDH
jgi:Uma2 family endonuclease